LAKHALSSSIRWERTAPSTVGTYCTHLRRRSAKRAFRAFRPLTSRTSVGLRFDDLDAIAADVRKFKDSLRVVVDERGGIGKLAELTHMPQPSISRFCNSSSIPRRATLNKFARALDLSGVQMATPWDV
jgi:hypothetical protein